MWFPQHKTIQLWLAVVFLTVAAVLANDDGDQGGLAFSQTPTALMCNRLCRSYRETTSCQCPTIDPCKAKKCRRGSRCKSFGRRPVCIPIARGCLQPKSRGLCTGNFFRFYYNEQLDRCMFFNFGGCSPNLNNFLSRRSCRKICMGI